MIVINFKNDKFYISPNTINSAIKELRKEDKDLKEMYERGKVSNGWIIYLKTELNTPKIRSILTPFIEKYEHLYFNVVKKIF